jgi:7,8-dihydropterin-6-yl-methyl-4-(beta-D-ribofuranosyl)aminobenzene 5'-phosphate synthase
MVGLVLLAGLLSTQEPRRVTVLYDAFGAASSLKRDWGFAALVEYGGKRILFDTGNDAAIFERNVKSLGVDLTKLDAVFLSHRHGDHTSGLSYLLKVNPEVRILVPQEGAYFKGGIPRGFLERYPDLPENLRYYGGKDPERWISGTPWPQARFEIVTQTTEILPGFFALTTKSQKPGTMEMNEVSLAIRTSEGLAVIVGCSHPGVEKILEEGAKIDPNLYTVTGGFHLVMTPEPEVRRVAELLRDQFRIERVAPGHCTSELGFATFQKSFGERFDAAGVGAVIPLP